MSPRYGHATERKKSTVILRLKIHLNFFRRCYIIVLLELHAMCSVLCILRSRCACLVMSFLLLLFIFLSFVMVQCCPVLISLNWFSWHHAHCWESCFAISFAPLGGRPQNFCLFSMDSRTRSCYLIWSPIPKWSSDWLPMSRFQLV